MLLSLVKRVHPADIIFSHDTAVFHAMRPLTKKPRLHDPSSNEASQSGTWTSLPPSRGCTERDSRRKKSHTARQALVGVKKAFLVSRQKSGIESGIRAQVQCDSCPLFEIPARALQITSNPLRRWCCSSHTEEAGPPRPPPEPPPGVSTAPPRRMKSGGSTSPCPSCSSVFSSAHNMKAHARRTNPGTPIVAEGLTCGFCDSSTVFPTSASRAGHCRKCRAYQRAKNGQRNSASSNDSRSPSATPPLPQPPPAAEPRQSTGGPAAHAVGMPPSSTTERPTLWRKSMSHDSVIRDGKVGRVSTESSRAINEY
ncbi:hypothetical protein ECC02_003532 [Trypanosoma cruzi]|uniref:C2H2-type domain-containing protein n=1 Tax=Trypanosoma cruzi TaxID=5693 RepID=A0A7J6XJR2_TRYCR|nr:hypothetical protein ECC02_012684 [Trypanosoma cruzi]KAF5223513.1 hypothetical protein ECC02_003532 [Trypanosoma cruzi]